MKLVASPGTPSATPVLAYIGLGANLGDARTTLQAAVQALADTPFIDDCVVSPWYCTAPVDSSGPDYINGVARLHTSLAPMALLHVLQSIESTFHRTRPYRNAPRTLDLDLLWMSGVEMSTPTLTVPHPRMHERAFVLRPLLDLDPAFVLPQGDWHTLLARCADQPIRSLDP